MKIKVILEQEDFNAIHDVILSVKGYKPSNEDIQKVWDKLPFEIQILAIQWGSNDTVFRDDLYTWLENN
jgi:hypothetical protein